MAMYLLRYSHIQRKKGQSSCAAAAYRSGSIIYDERLGITHDFSRKEKVSHAEIIAPNYAPEWVNDREQLWNKVESANRRHDSRPASELLVSLPPELNQDQQKELVRNFVKENLTDRGLVADLGFHNLDANNPHCHILFSSNKINEQGFGKKDRSLMKKDFLSNIRENWEHHANEALLKAGRSERIDHRTLEEQGIDRIPQIHLGAAATAMEKKGIQTERGDQLREIKEANARIQTLKEKHKSLEEELAEEQQKREQQQNSPEFNSLRDLNPEQHTKVKWDNLSLKESQRLNQGIRIYEEFEELYNHSNFPKEKLKYNSEQKSRTDFPFQVEKEHFVASLSDTDFILYKLDRQHQLPDYGTKKIHLRLNQDNNQPELLDYNINRGEYNKLQKDIPNELNQRLENHKAKYGERKQEEVEETLPPPPTNENQNNKVSERQTERRSIYAPRPQKQKSKPSPQKPQPKPQSEENNTDNKSTEDAIDFILGVSKSGQSSSPSRKTKTSDGGRFKPKQYEQTQPIKTYSKPTSESEVKANPQSNQQSENNSTPDENEIKPPEITPPPKPKPKSKKKSKNKDKDKEIEL